MCHFSIRDKLRKLWSWRLFTLLVFLSTVHFFLLLLCNASCIFFFFSSVSYLKEFGFTIPDRPIMVDDIRVRGCGKSGIKSVYKAKMGTGQAKPVTVHGLSYAHTQLNILYTCKHTGTLLLHLVQAYIEFPSRPFTNIFSKSWKSHNWKWISCGHFISCSSL